MSTEGAHGAASACWTAGGPGSALTGPAASSLPAFGASAVGATRGQPEDTQQEQRACVGPAPPLAFLSAPQQAVQEARLSVTLPLPAVADSRDVAAAHLGWHVPRACMHARPPGHTGAQGGLCASGSPCSSSNGIPDRPGLSLRQRPLLSSSVPPSGREAPRPHSLLGSPL